MKQIFRSKYQQIFFDKDCKSMYFYWKNHEIVNIKKFVKELTEGISLIESFLPVNLLLDMSNFTFLVSPEEQNKVKNFIHPMIEYVDLQNVAVVLPDDEVIKLSVMQTVEEAKLKDEQIEVKFFRKKDIAEKWLSENCEKISDAHKQYKQILRILKD